MLYPIRYKMTTVNQTQIFRDWLDALRDETAKAKILVRIQRLADGNPGKVEAVGNGVSEMKINYGPGYRVYYKQTGKEIILLLCGGDKSTQDKDIKLAKELAGT